MFSPGQRKVPRAREDEERLPADMIALAWQYGRYGYRKIAEFLRRAGGQVNDKRVERLWRREGLKVPAKQPKRGRLWLTDGSCMRLRAEYDGRKFRMLNIVDEFTRGSYISGSGAPAGASRPDKRSTYAAPATSTTQIALGTGFSH